MACQQNTLEGFSPAGCAPCGATGADFNGYSSGDREYRLIMIWIEFSICVASVIAASTVLTRYADVIAEKTGLGRS
jgi:ACR3 family arsenite efflux pump ArsB